MTGTNSSGDHDPVRRGIGLTVAAIPQPALAVDRDGRIHFANAGARALSDGDPASRLQDMALVSPAWLRSRLERAARMSMPSFLRLEFPKGDPVVFRATRVPLATGGHPELLLLIADQAQALISKFVDMKTAELKIRQHMYVTRQHQHELRQEAQRLKRLSETDPLTGLWNLRAFETGIRRAMTGHTAMRGVLVFVDLNDFKDVNDDHGHGAGDAILRHVGQALLGAGGADGFAGRLGGDEFAIWHAGAGAAEAAVLQRDLRDRIARLVYWTPPGAGENAVRLSVSAAFGAAFFPDEDTTYEGLKRLADRRMYRDKARLRHARAQSGIISVAPPR